MFVRLPAAIAVPLFLIFSGTLEVSAQEISGKIGTQWRPYVEWSLENPSFDGNAFDLEARAVFLHEGTGTRIATPMFYDGSGVWKFRFTGIATGEWTFRTFSDDEDLDGRTGVVQIRENRDPAAHGFMKAFGSKWGWEGTEEVFVPQYVMGKHPSAYLDTDGRVDTSRIEADIREFVDEHGFTGFHVAAAGQWFEGENPDLRIYRALEVLISKVHERGGASHIWLWGSDGGNSGSGPRAIAGGPMSTMDQRNLRYLAARLGPLPGWSMGYGYDVENGWATREELDEWKAFLENRMGWRYFLGARVASDEKGLWAATPQPPPPPRDAAFRAPIEDRYTYWLGGDYVGYTSYRPLYPRYVEALHHHPDRPSFEEDRFRLRDVEGWRYKDYDPELTRRGLWHSAMAGGVANIWGNLLPSDDEGGSRPYAIKHQIKTYSSFFKGRFLQEMETEYLGPELRLTSHGGTHFIIYREDTEIVRLDLTRLTESRPAVAVDSKAEYREIDIGPLAPGVHTWEAPYRSDWAVAVGRF